METTKIQRSVGENKSALVAEIPEACASEDAAVEFLERQRWGSDPACPHCGTLEPKQMRGRDKRRNARYLWTCVKGCKKQFTVRVGTVMEDSRIPLKYWCLAFYRACASKKGVSALQIHRETGISYRSALFLMHRIRWAMANGPGSGKLGQGGGTVEVDETYIGGYRRGGGPLFGTNKSAVLAMVERGGRIVPRHITDVTAKTLKGAIREMVDPSAAIMTDELRSYLGIGKEFEGGHHTVKHARKEYVRGVVHTNTVEGFFGLLKRGVNGTFHSVSKKHLHRYLAEFAFRYNLRGVDDGERTQLAIKASDGARLTYSQQVKSAGS